MDASGLYQRPYVAPDDEDNIDDIGKAKKRFFPDTYLDSPILIHKRVRWIAALGAESQPKGRKTFFERNVEEARRLGANNVDFETVDPDQYRKHYHFEWPSTLSSEWDESTEIASSIYESVRLGLKNRIGVSLPRCPVISSPQVVYWLSRWSFFDSLVEEYSRQSAQTGLEVMAIRLGNHTRVIATKDMWFLKCSRVGSYAYTYDQILMLKDLMFSRAQVFIAADCFYPNQPGLIRAIEDTCQWHESCLDKWGNQGFEILKETESLSKAYLSEMTDKIFGTDGPYGRMLDKVREKERDWGAKTSFLADDFDKVLRKIDKLEHVVEIFGLLKISGHPLIDPMLGGRSAAEVAREPDKTNFIDAQRLDWEFKRCMLLNYIKKHGSWPTLEFSKAGKKTALHKAYRKQFRGLRRNSYPLTDWSHCRFTKIVEFDYAPNYLEFLDDKAISLYRSNIAAFWDKNQKEKSHRRLLLELIEREELNVRQIVNLIIRREVPLDWLIVSVHPKEREFKLAPRMFSMLVLEIRIFFALTEANIADRIFPYLPQQTMTMNKTQISSKFLEITRPMSEGDALRMFVEIDLTRWNLRWRAASIDPIGRTLNDMFGVVGIFDYCHTFFSESLIVVRVADLRPEGIEKERPQESELLWYNHLGGFEGICQKLWTIATYMMISLAINDLPLGYTLIGQGDNQILSIVTSRRSNMTDKDVLMALREQVLGRISDECLKVNQLVKVFECLESTSIITYSKDIFAEGVYYPTTLKFHSRLFPHSSQIFPSVRTNLGAIFSTSVAGAEKSTQPMISHFLACLYGALYLTRVARGRGPFGRQLSVYRSKLKQDFPEWIKFVLTLPSEAGGFPIVPFLGFTYKGGSDPLGKSLSAMDVLGRNSDNRLYNRMLSQMFKDIIYNKKPDLRALFSDPFSVPIQKPVTSTDGISQETLEALKPRVKTRDIRELMSADTSAYMDKLVEVLSQCTPLNPLIMRDVLDCSVAGVTDTIGKMFVATRTLQQVVRALGVPIVDSVLHLESSGIDYMFRRYVKLPNDPAPSSSIFHLTEQCRARWFPGETCPIVGLTTYQPLDFPIEFGCNGLNKEGLNAVLMADSDPLSTRGPQNPYTGGHTREKRSNKGYIISGTDSASRDMRKLQLIASQTGQDPSFLLALDAVGWSRTNTKLSSVSHLLPGTSGGTLSHRYSARAGHQDASNMGSPNFATHVVISSDNVGYLAGGVYDYPIMFQEFLLFLIWSLGMRFLESPGSFSAATLVTQGSNLEPLPNVTILGPKKFNLPVLRFPRNPLVYIQDLKLEHVAGAIQHPSLPLTDDFTPSRELRRMTLEAFFRNILRQQSMGRQIADGSKQHFAGKTMDIAEVRSNGLWMIAKAIRNVVVDEALVNFMMTDMRGISRWNVMTYASKLVSPLAMSVTPQIGHPHLSNDPAVVQFNLYDAPSYAGGIYASHDNYCSLIQKMVAKAITGNETEYNHRKIAIFTSDNSRVLSETLTSCLLTDLYIWTKKGILTSSEMSLAISDTLLPAMRSQHAEKDKVAMVIRAASNISRLLESVDLPAAQVARSLSQGRISGYKCTIEDMLKSTRDTDKWGIVVANTPPRRVIRPTSSLLPQHDTWTPETSLEMIVGPRLLEKSRSTDDAILVEGYFRNLGTVGHLGGTGVFTWSMFSKLLSHKPLIIIGSGMGAAARVAIDNGCQHVFGLDKRSTIPKKSHRFRSYKPPLVMGSEYSEKYTQLVESYVSSGDWFDTDVSKAVLSYDSGDMTVLIDIQRGADRFGTEVLQPILPIKKAGNIILRLFLTKTEHELICSDFSGSGITFYSYTIESFGTVYPVIFVLTQWSPVLMTSTAIRGSLDRNPLRVDIPPNTDPFQLSIAKSEAVLNVFMPGSSDTATEIFNHMISLVNQTRGDYDSRFSYGQWTKMLQALASAYFMTLSEDDRPRVLLQWLYAGTLRLKVAKNVFTIKVNWQFCYHLSTAVARVC